MYQWIGLPHAANPAGKGCNSKRNQHDGDKDGEQIAGFTEEDDDGTDREHRSEQNVISNGQLDEGVNRHTDPGKCGFGRVRKLARGAGLCLADYASLFIVEGDAENEQPDGQADDEDLKDAGEREPGGSGRLNSHRTHVMAPAAMSDLLLDGAYRAPFPESREYVPVKFGKLFFHLDKPMPDPEQHQGSRT